MLFALALLLEAHESRAFDDNDTTLKDPSAYSRTVTTPFIHAEQNQQLSQIRNYVRGKIPGLLPGLPNFLRNPNSWFGQGFGMTFGDTSSDPDSSSVMQKMNAMPASPSVASPEALWLAPNYHHAGFLPLHDAMIMDAKLRQNLPSNFFSNTMQFEIHPFYGQNWHSSENYWGNEIALGLGSNDRQESWGKMALRFSSGDSDLLDRGHGFDLHSEINFDERLSFHAGIRENGNSSSGDYVLLRWKLVDGF